MAYELSRWVYCLSMVQARAIENNEITVITIVLLLKYHHFRSYVARDGEDPEGKIHVLPIGTQDQLAEIFTKAVAQDLFLRFRKAILGW